MTDASLDTRLDEPSILDEARARTGLSDFGSDEFREPMRVLLAAFEAEGRLHPVGRATQRQRVVDLLVNRLYTQDWIRRHPEILDERIDDPIVIVGFPRTGTTMLHRTIASERRIHSLKWYESRNPAPFPGWDPANPSGERDPRIAEAEEQIRVMLEGNPDLAAVHPFEAEGPDEEIMLLEHSFMSGNPPAFVNVPSYFDWISNNDNSRGYAYMKRMLQFLQWQKRRAGGSAERWVLKTPHHMYHLDLVFEQFPRATVIQTHRDPIETIPSFASMNCEIHRLASDECDDHETADQWFRRLARATTRGLEVRDAMGEGRFIDVWYRDAILDPIAQVRRVYERVGMDLTSEAEGDMLAWAEQNRRDARPTHHYTLEQFGLTVEGIEGAFADYRKRFIIGRAEATLA